MGRVQTVAAIALMVRAAFGASAAELPDAIAAKGETALFQVHAEGAQIYECKAAQTGGKPAWQFREPIASLFRDGKTVGRHYAGPTWEIDGGAIVGKVSARAPARISKDIPWLKLEVTDRADDGPLKDATAVQRINTVGGVLEGDCATAGELRSEPYAADYVFLKKQ